ncbi:MAG: hypothetical protein NTW38_06755 [Candidatus Aminicenantes bacterium]|nr:hypothetical protein [Candidatus Aminicenantes bacterium]
MRAVDYYRLPVYSSFMIRRALIAFLVLGLFATALSAGPGRDGQYIMLSGQSLDYHRDLDRGLTLWHFEKEFYIPGLEKCAAWVVSYGMKSYGGSWDVSFLRSGRTVDLENGPHTATYQAFDLNGRSFFLKKLALRPYFLGGITIPFIRVKGGSFYRGKTLNASYFGAGLNVGAGLWFDVGPSVFINAAVMYRWVGFLYAYGEGKGRDINDLRVGYMGPEFGRMLRTDVLTLTVGVGFVL